MKVSNEHSETIRPKIAPKTLQENKPDASMGRSKGIQAHTSKPAALVHLSERSQDLKGAEDLASAASDIGEKKVAELKKKLESGAYKVDSQRIAAKILEGK